MKRHLLLLAALGLCCRLLPAQIPCNGEFILSGDASNQADCIQLTADEFNQSGCAWLNSPVDFSMPFTHTMTANFGDDDGGADGICLVYQPGGTGVCGGLGIGIGAAGIPNSFIIEFDTWDNGAGQADIPQDHSAISLNGDLTNQLQGPVALPNIEDGNDHTITFTWDPATDTYTVSFDGNLLMSGVYDIINNVFGGNNMAFWGYTSATGGASNEHLVCPVLPPPIIVEAGPPLTLPCPEGIVTLNAVASQGPNYFYSWSSPDGGTIIAGSNTLTPTVQGPGTYVLTLADINGGCEETDETVITVDPIEAQIAAPPFAPCLGSTVVLDGSGSSAGPNITYQWSSPDGVIISDPTLPFVEVSLAGTYTLTVIYDDGNLFCTTEASVELLPDPNVPTAVAVGGILTCDNTAINLSGAGSSFGPAYTYQWTSPDGIIISGDNTLEPTVAAAGTYTLEVTNTDNNCTAETSVLVEEDFEEPTAQAEVSGTLDCAGNSVTLDGSGSTTGADITYSWNTPDGALLSGADSLSAETNTPGTYLLLVEKESNGCTQTATVTVAPGPPPPALSLAAPDTLNCADSSVLLSATLSVPADSLQLEWTSQDGVLQGPANDSVATALAAGTYQLTAVDTQSACVAVDSVTVVENTAAPLADAGLPATLSCGEASVALDGSGSSTASGVVYSWTALSGTLLSGQNTLQPEAGSAGQYQLQVLDTLNACSALDTVTVSSDVNAPEVQILPPDTLNCTQTAVVLDATASDQGPDYEISWATVNGQLASGAGGLSPTVDAPGSYTLLIRDTTNGCESGQTVQVVQDTVAPVLSVLPPDTLDCAQTVVSLSASSSSANNIQFSWSSADGNLIAGGDGLNPQVDAPGTYQLLAVDADNGCQRSISTLVRQDTVAPLALIAPAPSITCSQPAVQLDASGASSGPAFSYTWSTNDGIIDAGGDSLTPTVGAAGNYQLEVRNQLNQCSSSASAAVIVDTLPPDISLGEPPVLNCFQAEQPLPALAAGDASNWRVLWEGPNGFEADELQPEVSDPGVYYLSAQDSTNGCSAYDTLQVGADFQPPEASIAVPDLLTCTDTLVVLDGSASSAGSGIAYEWATADGVISGGGNTAVAEVSQSGLYVLSVLDNTNGCSARDSVQVQQDVGFPVASIAPPAQLDCNTDSVALDASASSAGPQIQLQWGAPGGLVLSGEQPMVYQAGVYQLTVVDNSNNCRATTQVAVSIDTLAPMAEAGPPLVLNCQAGQQQLDGTASASGPGIRYRWSSAAGQILEGGNSPTPTVGSAGLYELEVLDEANGCLQTDTVRVTEDFVAPSVQLPSPDTLTCSSTQVVLDASGASGSGEIAYHWSGPDGALPASSADAVASVSTPGLYTLQLRDLQNFCSDTLQVSVVQDTMPPEAAIAPPDTLDCATAETTLAASVAGNYSYEWSTEDGLLLSGEQSPEAVAAAPGYYELNVLRLDNGCSQESGVALLQDTIPPEVNVSAPPPLNCERSSLVLDGSASSAGPEISYQWSTDGGSILEGQATPQASIDAPGAYQLLLRNADNACTDSLEITVEQDTMAPSVAILPPDTLDCETEQVALAGSAAGAGDRFRYQWSALSGNLLDGLSEAQAEADEPGTYQLVVTDTVNACVGTAEVVVAQDTITPQATVAPPDTLDCETLSLLLDGSGSSAGPSIQYNWTSSEGQIVSGAAAPVAEAGAPGFYHLEVLNTRNSCRSTVSVTVAQDTLAPQLLWAPPALLTCAREQVQLDASGSDAGPGFALSWEGPPGGLASGAQTLSPSVALPGDYRLQVENSSNGCRAEATITVSQDTVAPIADAGADFTIPCFPERRRLDGSGSSQGQAMAYSWSSPDGQLGAGSYTLTPEIEGPGTYELLVENQANGCSARDEVLVRQNIPEASAAIEQPGCFGEQGRIELAAVEEGEPPYVYSVDGGAQFQSEPFFSSLPPGVYEWVVQDVNGCEDRATVEIVQPDSLTVWAQPDVVEMELGEEQPIFTQVNLPEDSLALIAWDSVPGLSCYDCLQPVASPQATTDYRLLVRTAAGCEDQLRVRIYVAKGDPVYIPNAFSPNGDGANDHFFIQSKPGVVANIRTLRVFNRWGEPVFRASDASPNDPEQGWDGRFRGELLNSGVFAYFAEVEFVDGRVELLRGDVALIR